MAQFAVDEQRKTFISNCSQSAWPSICPQYFPCTSFKWWKSIQNLFYRMVEIPHIKIFFSCKSPVFKVSGETSLSTCIQVQFWDILLEYFYFITLRTSTPLHLRGKHCTFYSTHFILQLKLLYRLWFYRPNLIIIENIVKLCSISYVCHVLSSWGQQ